MSYLLAQILVCLLIAGLIGAIIGWFLRGDCTDKLKECEDKWKTRVGMLENEWNARLNSDEKNLDLSEIVQNKDETEQATLKGTNEEEHTQKDTQLDNDSKAGILQDTKNSLDNLKSIASQKGIKLSESKLALYKENGIDFETNYHLDDNYDIQAIEGIGPKYATILKSLGINTTKDLVDTLHKNQNKIQQVASKLDVKPEVILSWISMADVIKLPGVDSQAAELLQTVGISSVSELAVTNPNSLHNEMVSFNKKTPIIPEVPTLDSVTIWTKIAKYL